MVYRLEDIARDVRVAIDENSTGERLIPEGDAETLELDDIVRGKICEAVRRVESAAALHLLDSGHVIEEDSIHWEEHESGWILLPEEFMRLLVFKMSDWERPVWEAITPADPMYGRQSSRYKGVRGNCQKPVCAVVMRPEGKALEFYSCKSREATMVQGSYLPYPEVKDGGIEICKRCYDAVVYMCAGLTVSAYGENERAEYLITKSKELMV